MKKSIKKIFNKFGYTISKTMAPDNPTSNYIENFISNPLTSTDIGSNYADNNNVLPHFLLSKTEPFPSAPMPTLFTINNGNSQIKERMAYSHLTLLKLCKHFNFSSILDIGSRDGNATRIFKFLGKDTTSIEIAKCFKADYHEDYLKKEFNKKFDAIWCSHTFEHQRNPGIFLNKVFDDLKEKGILALTVPLRHDLHIEFGHINMTTPLKLIYQLVCAGFDCRNICLKVYNDQIGVILEKVNNNIKNLSFGSIPPPDNLTKEFIHMTGDELCLHMSDFFPFPVKYPLLEMTKDKYSINWNDPI